jgi:arginine/lysine/ornithine decarboxylase
MGEKQWIQDLATGLTAKNLDRLAEFLTRQQENADLVDQIPDGAHIFQGAYDDSELTQENVNHFSRAIAASHRNLSKAQPQKSRLAPALECVITGDTLHKKRRRTYVFRRTW